MEQIISFTEEEKYILKPIVMGQEETDKVGKMVIDFLGGYLYGQDSTTTASDDYLTNLMQRLYEKLCDIEKNILNDVLVHTDWDNCFEEE